MHVKTYRDTSPAAALTRVKAELGDDVVILSNRTITDDDGKRCCEVVVGLEHPTQGRAAQARAGRAYRSAAGPAPALSKDDFLGEALESSGRFAREWQQIRGHFLALMKSQMDLSVLSGRQRVAMDYLEREGVAETALLTVYRELAADPARTVLPVLQGLADCRAYAPGAYPEKFQIFAGPSGVGKTSALLRLALRHKKAQPKARVCVVAADPGRGQGRRMLRHYAELSNLAFREAPDLEAFGLLLAEAGQFDRVFVDLPALSGEATLAGWLAERGLAPVAGLAEPEAESGDDPGDAAAHLVLAPHYAEAQLEAFAERYASPRLKSIIWTKLDEACTFGALVNMAQSLGLPASALSYGPGLKNSLAGAEPEMLWRLLFKHQLPGSPAAPGKEDE
ncbi:MAG: flagellar biosynthesis protein FlhF [Desulfovibrionaceae bacterium]